METIKGYIDHFIYQNEQNGYAVLVLIVKNKEITCVGNCRDLQMGESIEAEGDYVQNPMYGKQFKIEKYRVVPPADKDSMERYLGSGAIKGVGAALAARIVKNFGDDTLRIIEEEPERLAEIKGISMRMAMEIAVQVEEKRDLRDAMIFLGQYHISQALAVKIYETYGTSMYTILKENPYRLAEDIHGVGFITADTIASEMGMPIDSGFRIRCGLYYTLQQAIGEGHVYLPIDILLSRGMQLLSCSEEAVKRELDGLVFDRRIIVKNDNAYTSAYYYAELNCAAMLHDRNLRLERMEPEEEEILMGKLKKIAGDRGMEVDPLQLEAVRECVKNGIFLLSGGPGTGKTTTINLMIRYFMSQGMDLLLAAPTGRAAKRMSEATGFEATTIHRLLEVGGNPEAENSAVTFQRNEDNPLEADVIIIDETSMVDIMLFQGLLKAIVPGTRLILVGDVDQLPSVGAGQVLRDVINSGAYPCLKLQKIFRQALNSDIVVNAHKINKGEQIRLDTNSKDFLFLERNNESVIKEIMVWMMRDKLPGYCKTTPLDIQVLTPMRKGTLGCIELNRFLQSQLNPADDNKREHLAGDYCFREGDKVMQIKNNYKLEWKITGRFGMVIDSGLGVFNGDMGRIVEIDEPASQLVVEFDDKRVVEYPFSLLDEIEPAYAITIHKAQGSEYPAVIIPVLDTPALMRYRNLLYTGITRAKSCVVLLGCGNIIRNMIDNAGENNRYSSLCERIREIEGE
ncbi:MAG: ATP-dependent RecD-like DNA helicase [Lachnospiraceae bacterium]|nr:ATP-dependent RecD-like DNA helicase [Lachnospiraceae bacterium]